MSSKVVTHIHVLVRLAHLGAPAAMVQKEVRRLANFVDDQHGATPIVEAALLSLLDRYDLERQELLGEAALLVSRALPNHIFVLGDDLARLARRAQQEGWPIADKNAFAEFLDLVVRFDALSDTLRREIEALLNPYLEREDNR